MARPTKQGVDYFPLDVHLDDKFKFIEIKYKLEGFAILVKVIQKIYSYGYWYKWTEDETLLFSDEVRADFSLVENVVKEAIERDVFNKEMYEKHKILTSKGIQKRYKEMVRRRKDVEVIAEYLLIDNIIGVNDVNNSINADIETEKGVHNDGKSTQSKVNKTKQNKSNKPISPKFEICDMENAKHLYDLMLKNDPKAKQPNFDKWANDFRLLREKDERPLEEIKWFVDWSQNHSFWKTNILSAAKFREKYNQMYLQAKQEHEKRVKIGGHKKQNTIDWENV